MELFKQVRQVTIDKLLFDFEELDIEFNIKCTSDNKSDVATIDIYNLTDETKNKLKKGQFVSINAGYRELQGTIFNGVVDSVRSYRSENDIVTTITATPNNFLYANTIVNTQFKAGITARQILDTLNKQTAFNIDIKGLGKNITYPNGKVFSNRLPNVISVLAKDTNSNVRVENSTIIFTEKGKIYSTVINLGAENGLVRVEKHEEKTDINGKNDIEVKTKENKKGEKVAENQNKQDKSKKATYTIECFLIPIVRIGQVLNINSTFFTGKLVVKEVEYTAKDINTFSAICKCEVV